MNRTSVTPRRSSTACCVLETVAAPRRRRALAGLLGLSAHDSERRSRLSCHDSMTSRSGVPSTDGRHRHVGDDAAHTSTTTTETYGVSRE